MTTNKTYRRELHAIVRDTFNQLQKIKEQNDQAAFNYSMEKILPGVKKYIARWLNRAIKDGKIPAGKYKVEDFVDELYIMAYDHIHEVKEDRNLHSWIFKKADELLEDTEVEEDFDHFFFKNLDNYTKAEWEEMEEKFSADGDGDLVMEEELDDNSYAKNDYVLEDVIIEDKEKDIIEKLNTELKAAQINRHINLVLHQLATPIQTVFDLNVKQAFLPDEIAQIKQISIQQVEQYLTQARESIRISFEKRFSISS